MADPLKIKKQVLDSTVGTFNKGNADTFTKLSFANKNLFDFIIFPAYPEYSIGDAGGTSFVSNTLMKLYLQSISVPGITITHENLNETKFMSGVEYPESITLNFLETDTGLVRLYIDSWFGEIFDAEKDIFRDNQLRPIKNAIIIPQTRTGSVGPVSVELRGLVIKGFSELEWNHANGNEPLMIAVTCKVDTIRFRKSTDLV